MLIDRDMHAPYETHSGLLKFLEANDCCINNRGLIRHTERVVRGYVVG